MRWLPVVILWVLSFVLYLAILNGLRWLGIERESFDFIGRLTIAIGCTFVLDRTVIRK
jgi:hypothetical protein